MANFSGHPNVIEADRLDHWMAYLFGIAIAVGPISPALMGILLVPAVFILVPRFFKCYGVSPIIRYIKTPLGMCLIALFTWFLFTSIFSIKPDKSFQVAIRTAVMILAVTMLYHYARERSGFALKVLKVSTIVFVAWAFFADFLLYFSPDGFELFQKAIAKKLDVTTFFKNDGALSVIYMPLLFCWFVRDKGIGKAWAAAALIIVLALVMNGAQAGEANRAALVGLLIALLGAGCFYLIRRFCIYKQVSFVVCAVLIALIAKIGMLEKLPEITKIGGTPPAATLPLPDHHRQIIWSFVYDKVKENLILGVGIDSVKRTEFANVKMPYHNSIDTQSGELVYSRYGEYVPSHPHNWMLEIASETGLLGLFLLIICLVNLAFILIKRWNATTNSTTIIAASFFMLIGFWSSSMANFSIWSAWWLISFFVMMALMMAAAIDGSMNSKKIKAED